MANTIKIRRSGVPGKVPTASDLQLGELGLNYYDGKLYTKKSVSGVESIVELSGGSSGGGLLNEIDGGSSASVFTTGMTILDGGAA